MSRREGVRGAFLQTDALMIFDKRIWRCVVGRNGRAKAGPYRNRRPAEADAGRYRYPACDTIQIRRALARVKVGTRFSASVGRGVIVVCKDPPHTQEMSGTCNRSP